MRVGFTGTRRGMTDRQWSAVNEIMWNYLPAEFHHGDCWGADSQAHAIARQMGEVRIICHPPKDMSFRAYCQGYEICPPRPYIERNHAIVDAVDWMIATPETAEEVLRSGTWATIRYARERGKNVRVIDP